MSNRKPRKMRSFQIGGKRIEHWKIISVLLIAYDFVAVCAAYFLALWLRFMFRTRKSEKISLDFA